MSQPAEYGKTDDERLALEVASYSRDPLGYVMFSWPWDSDRSIQQVKLPDPWCFEYDCEFGPDGWACEFLVELGDKIASNGFDIDSPRAVDPVQMIVASGHGVGKGALTAWLTGFILDTRPGSKGMGTANTAPQLRTKTFSEIAKWTKLKATAHWWDISTGDMYIRSVKHPGGNCSATGVCSCPETWRFDCVPWRKEASEAFAGLHAAHASPFYIFDEGSAIHDEIWKVANGGLTDGEPFWFVFGNPTRNNGKFFDCFHRDKHRWSRRQIDSREVQITNKKLFDKWIEDYGEDSDFVRVRVKGQFPRAGSNQLIGNDLVRAAQLSMPEVMKDDPLVMGVDPARFGDDEAVICVRQGLDAVTHEWRFFRSIDVMQLAARVAEYAEQLKKVVRPVQAIFVDGGGVGGGVIDRLQMLGYPVWEVHMGGKADNPVRFLRKDAEMWWRMKDWLEQGAIPEDQQLADQMTSREYGFNDKQQLWIMPKKQMKEEGFESPDRAEALACTFAYPVHGQDLLDDYDKLRAAGKQAGGSFPGDYNPFDRS